MDYIDHSLYFIALDDDQFSFSERADAIDCLDITAHGDDRHIVVVIQFSTPSAAAAAANACDDVEFIG